MWCVALQPFRCGCVAMQPFPHGCVAMQPYPRGCVAMQPFPHLYLVFLMYQNYPWRFIYLCTVDVNDLTIRAQTDAKPITRKEKEDSSL